MTPSKLVNWRKKLNLSREEAGELIGVHSNTILAYENNKRKKIPDTVALACAAISKKLPPIDVLEWFKESGLNKAQASKALGIHRNSFHTYLNTGNFPKTVRLAASALRNKVKPIK